MAARIIVAVIFIPIIFLVLFFFPPFVLPFCIAALAAIGVHELLWSTGMLKHPRLSAYSIVLSALIPIWVYYGAHMTTAVFAIFVYVLLLFLESMFDRRHVGFEKLAGAFFACIMIPLFLSSFIRIGAMPMGRVFLVMPFLFPFMSDAGGYFAGRAFGRHKLAPEISPNKTKEGSVGCFAGAVIGGLIYGVIVSYVFSYTVNYGLLILYAIFGSLVSQLGDLSFSFIKREYGLKDFGNILPGHGGVLDRFDSVIFAAPLLEFLIYFWPAVVK